MTFREELQHLINKFSKENGSDTPDYILAEFMEKCLQVYEETVKRRDAWHHYEPRSENRVEVDEGVKKCT